MTDDIPSFTFSPEELAKIRQSVGVTDDELPPTPTDENPVLIEQPPARRKRGRPKKSSAPIAVEYAGGEPEPSLETPFPPAPLTKRDEREVAKRLANILTGSTGMASMVKPYLQMTDEEAESIAEPLASYLVRNEDTIPVARQILENYDLVAIAMGTTGYVVRVYRDREAERAQSVPKVATLRRVEQARRENANESEGTPEVRTAGEGISYPSPRDGL